MTDPTFVLVNDGLEAFMRLFPAPDPEAPQPADLTHTISHKAFDLARLRRLEAGSRRYLADRAMPEDEWPDAPDLEVENMSAALGIVWGDR